MSDPRTECDFIGSHLMNGPVCDRCGYKPDKYFCTDCDKVMTKVSGLTRHTTTMHLREPKVSELAGIDVNYFNKKAQR